MSTISGERRKSTRFPLHLRLRYRVLDGLRTECRGTGITLDISRTGVRFKTGRELAENARVELTMDWPIRLANVCPMKLDICGAVVRSADGDSVVRVESWQFRVAPARRAKVMAAGVRSHGWSPRTRESEEVALPMSVTVM